MTTPDANDVLFGSGIPAARFTSPGDTYAGPIVKLEAVQARKFDKKTNRPTDELEYWDNGDPKMQAVATVRTDHRDPSDPSDDGQRKIYIASRDMQNKLREAVKAAGQRKLDVGAFLRVTYTHEAPSEAGPLAKFYEVEYRPASAQAANTALGIQQPAQQAQAAIPPVSQLIAPAAPAQPAQEAPAATGAPALDSLPPEARALVEKMLAGQQS